MRSRRSFLAGFLAAGILPAPTWADAGHPMFLSAARRSNGSFALFGLGDSGEVLFEIPLPDRGHAATAHPRRPEAVAFARRPGTYAVVLDCLAGRVLANLSAPDGRHFFGHGTFSPDGDLLFTTENDFDQARGMVGVWDVKDGYRRAGEFPSGGIGPHDIRLVPGSDALVIANGGIETHPEMGRTKLNLPTMRPNLSFVTPEGNIADKIELDPSLHKNSIRHLACSQDGVIAFAMQWQGDVSSTVPLVGLRKPDGTIKLLMADHDTQSEMQGYAGSVAIDPSASRVAITSPRGGICHVFDVATGTLAQTIPISDICGVAPGLDGFTATSGNGTVVLDLGLKSERHVTTDLSWDNHLVPLRQAST